MYEFSYKIVVLNEKRCKQQNKWFFGVYTCSLGKYIFEGDVILLLIAAVVLLFFLSRVLWKINIIKNEIENIEYVSEIVVCISEIRENVVDWCWL